MVPCGVSPTMVVVSPYTLLVPVHLWSELTDDDRALITFECDTRMDPGVVVVDVPRGVLPGELKAVLGWLGLKTQPSMPNEGPQSPRTPSFCG